MKQTPRAAVVLSVRLSHAKAWPKAGPIALRTANPYALASALRLAMRRAGADPTQIESQVEEVLTAPDPTRRRELCRPWVQVDAS